MSIPNLLTKLRVAYPHLAFSPGRHFSWSPSTKTITYPKKSTDSTTIWSLFHELGHALLNHTSYESDIELVALESEAWQKAQELAQQYGHIINDDYIQDCMDTYRDWLHQRSACPICDTRSLQQDSHTYRCHNCAQTWTVTTSRFCRPYRRKSSPNKTSPPESKVMFA